MTVLQGRLIVVALLPQLSLNLVAQNGERSKENSDLVVGELGQHIEDWVRASPSIGFNGVVLAARHLLQHTSGIPGTNSKGGHRDPTLPVQSHGGSVRGFVCEVRRYPTRNGALFILCNRGNFNPGPMADTLEAMLLYESKSMTRLELTWKGKETVIAVSILGDEYKRQR